MLLDLTPDEKARLDRIDARLESAKWTDDDDAQFLRRLLFRLDARAQQLADRLELVEGDRS
jgi:hypothetical protein